MRYALFFSLALLAGTLHPSLRPRPATPETQPLRQQDYALFFAVNDYTVMNDLANPIANARAIAKELRDGYGFQTEVVENPTLIDIEEKLAEYRAKFREGSYDQKGQLLIFFTGHGIQRGENGFFVPADGDPEIIHRTGLGYDYWRDEIDGIACQHILVTIDACHSITFDKTWNNKPERRFSRPGDATKDQVLLDHDRYRARLFITSDAQGEETPDRSTLADKFLLALRQHRAPVGYLTHDELFGTYLRQASPTPGGGDFGRNEPGSRFLFVRNQLENADRERSDLAAWQAAQTQDDCAAYRAYLAQFPRGNFADLAREKFAPCEAEERMIAAWAAARGADDCDSYETFVATYPASPYLAAAKQKMTTLKCTLGYPPEEMRFLSGGAFAMGDQFGDGFDNQRPVHTVKVSNFYLGRTEVTVGQFADFVAATGYQTDAERDGGSYIQVEYSSKKTKGVSWRDDALGQPRPTTEYHHPVLHLTWYDALAYCNWLSKEHGFRPVYQIKGNGTTADWSADGYRLPTEAEWEYAARSGGKKYKYAWGTGRPNGNVVDETARSVYQYFEGFAGYRDGYVHTAPVGSFEQGDWGLADLTGNVAEWCWDFYLQDYYSQTAAQDPRGPVSASDPVTHSRGSVSITGSITYRVVRGGSWKDSEKTTTVTYRKTVRPMSAGSDVGFRLARNG